MRLSAGFMDRRSDKRDPLVTCLSCYFKDFAMSQPYFLPAGTPRRLLPRLPTPHGVLEERAGHAAAGRSAQASLLPAIAATNQLLRRRAAPTNPTKPEPNSHAAAGTGTAFTMPSRCRV